MVDKRMGHEDREQGMTEADNHSIRFKRGGIEFELTSTADQVAAVWTSIEPSVVDAFTNGEVHEEDTDTGESENGSGGVTGRKTTTGRRRRTTRRRASGSTDAGGGRAEVVSQLAEADLTKFPKLPTK